jgi:hypothetical protein
MAMADPRFAPIGDENHDDLPRTFRREKEARAREAMERAAQERAMDPPTLGQPVTPAAAAGPQFQTADDIQPVPFDMAYPAAVQRFDVPFFHLMGFFLKAVFAAVPALIVLGVMLWFGGQLLEAVFPELIKMKILITFPN